METSQSPRMVLLTAHFIGQKLFHQYAGPFSRHDFTLAQLFACLVLREFFGLSYRRTEKLLKDSPQWLAEIGLRAPPDHNTLWRAFGAIIKARRVDRLLDLITACFLRAGRLRLKEMPLALDSTCFEQRHRSTHYDRRCRHMRAMAETSSGKKPEKPGSWGKSVNASRRRRLSAMPKLSVAVASSCHLILPARRWACDRSFRRASAVRRRSCRVADGEGSWLNDLQGRQIKPRMGRDHRAKRCTA